MTKDSPDRSQPPSRPLDVRPDWGNVTRVAQSICHDNNGLAAVTITVFVRGKEVLFFDAPSIRKFGPLSAPGTNGLTAEIVAAMACFLMDSSQEGFYLSRAALQEIALGNKKEIHARPE